MSDSEMTYSTDQCREILQQSSMPIEDQYTLLQYCTEAAQQHNPALDGVLIIFAVIGFVYTFRYIGENIRVQKEGDGGDDAGDDV